MAIMKKRKARKQVEMQMNSPAPDNRLQNSDKFNEISEPVITERSVISAMERLNKYRSGKSTLENRLIANEDYWKLRQNKNNSDCDVSTAWLFNCIISKHADIMDGYPESNIRPKRADDVQEAEKLKSILPVIFDENDYQTTYSDIANYFLKQGTVCVGVFWDGTKHDGLGDISIQKIDLLELFWESGITNIQDSKEVFLTKMEDNDRLVAKYPQLKGKLGGGRLTKAEYHYDDSIDNSNKSTVVDWYYKTYKNDNEILHYCKFVNGIVLFSSENEPEKYPNGWYDHGKYPFIIKALFPIEGTIAGYGYTDIGKGDQDAIDILTSSILKNSKATAKPRYFIKNGNSAINESEFADWNNDFVHIEGSIDEEHIRQITTSGLNSYVINMREQFINELKETLGNRDVNNGSTTSGITAASAIAALQESAGKISRTHNKIMYVLHKEITDMVIELIRQFYDVPREYRITGKMGQDEFVQYDNSGLKPQQIPSVLGIEMGLRLPCFDIEVNAQKASPYKKMEQNELAIQLYNLGVFNPQMADQALALLQTMDFNHKDEIIQIVAQNGTLMQKYQQLQQVAFQLAKDVDMNNGTNMADSIAQVIMAESGQSVLPNQNVNNTATENNEHPYVENARANAQNSTQVQD